MNNSFVIRQLGGFTGKKRERTFMKFLLLIFLKIFVRHQTDSDICKVLCPVFEACKSVVSFFSLSSPFKGRHSYVFLLARLLNRFLVSLFSEATNKARLK